jgi:hypothetical protein
VISPILSTIFELSGYKYWFALKEWESLNGIRLDIVVDYMKIPGFEDVYGLLFQGQQMTIFRDVLVENGVMWYELKEFKADYLKQQKRRIKESNDISLDGVSLALFDSEGHRRSFMALARYLKSKGANVALFLPYMKMSEYIRVSKEFDVYCPEILL